MVFDSFLRFRRPRTGQKRTAPEDEDIPLQQRPENSSPLRTISQLPHWYEPSPFILTGYRPASQSWYLSLSSWAYVHNESGNIYSHLIPGVILLLLVGQGSLYESVQVRHAGLLSGLDWMVVSGQILSGACCLLVSAVYHTGLNHSEGVARCWLGVDYGGILLLLLGDFVSGLHFGFYCAPSLKALYCALVCSPLSLPRFPSMHVLALSKGRAADSLDRDTCLCNRNAPAQSPVQRTGMALVSSGLFCRHWLDCLRPHRSRLDPLGSGVCLRDWSAVLPTRGVFLDHRVLLLGGWFHSQYHRSIMANLNRGESRNDYIQGCLISGAIRIRYGIYSLRCRLALIPVAC